MISRKNFPMNEQWLYVHLSQKSRLTSSFNKLKILCSQNKSWKFRLSETWMLNILGKFVMV